MLETKEKGQWKNSHSDGTASKISLSIMDDFTVRIYVVSPVLGENVGWVVYRPCKDGKDAESCYDEITHLIYVILQIERHA